jgi:hypothetical protein
VKTDGGAGGSAGGGARRRGCRHCTRRRIHADAEVRVGVSGVTHR